jgi:hypothetical protein
MPTHPYPPRAPPPNTFRYPNNQEENVWPIYNAPPPVGKVPLLYLFNK